MKAKITLSVWCLLFTTTTCTAYGFLDHSLKEDCDIIQSH